jgi:hypothetical protein
VLFALVRSPIAPLHAEPRVSSAQVSQALFGHALLVLERQGDWHRLRGMLDGYEGWCHAGYLGVIEVPDVDDADVVAPAAARTFAARGDDAGTDALLVGALAESGMRPPAISLGCTVVAGERRLRLPLGALVHAPQTVIAGETVPFGERGERFPRDGEAMAREASRWFEGAAYQWGGVTPWGADCSGFVQSLAFLHGIDLPRDAWQQAAVGDDAGADVEALAAGDLLLFSDRDDRRPTHVGLALGGARMAHLALGRGGWAVDDLRDADDPYVAGLRRSFLGARRVV